MYMYENGINSTIWNETFSLLWLCFASQPKAILSTHNSTTHIVKVRQRKKQLTSLIVRSFILASNRCVQMVPMDYFFVLSFIFFCAFYFRNRLKNCTITIKCGNIPNIIQLNGVIVVTRCARYSSFVMLL